MSEELKIYKQNRISEANNTYNTNVSRLQIILSNDISLVMSSTRISNKQKQILIKNLQNNYSSNISMLRTNLNNIINKINSFTPEFLVNKNAIKNKKALLIGINYIGTPYELGGCIDDSKRIKDWLSINGCSNFVMLNDLSNNKPTKNNILRELSNFIEKSNENDMLFLYYSGHGSYTYDTNNDETDKQDELLVSSDLLPILDDELKRILNEKLKKNVTLIGLFDCCNSGTILDLKYNYVDSNNYDKYFENNKATECNGNVIMLSGCMDSQTSAEAIIENKTQGALTWSFLESLQRNPNCSWRELLLSMRNLLKKNNFTQIPQLSTDSFYDITSKVFV